MYGLRELLDRSDSAHLSASASVRCIFAAEDVVRVLFLLDVRKRV
jgi:hypothetical protein